MPEGFPYAIEVEGQDNVFRSGIKVLPAFANQPRGSRQFDVSGFLADSGVDFPTGSSAIYYERTGGLIIVAPKASIEVAETLLRPMIPLDLGSPLEIRIEATLVRFRVDAGVVIRDLPYARLRSLAGKSWRELDRMSITTKSGQRAYALSKLGGGTDKRKSGELSGLQRTPATRGRGIGLSFRGGACRRSGWISR
jgi:hypothetical protein